MFVNIFRELNKETASKHKVNEELRKCRREITNLRVEVQKMKQEAKDKEDQTNLVEEEVKRYIAENSKLQEKLRVLQESISSPSGDPRTSAISRLLHESPAPFMRLSNLMDSPASLTPTIIRKGLASEQEVKAVKKPRLMGADELASMRPTLTDPEQDKKGKSLKLSQLSDTQGAATQEPQSFKFKRMKFDASAGSSSSQGYFYDGMGGHSKPDIYPSGKISSSQPTQRTIKMNIKGKIQTKTIDLFMVSHK